MPHYVKICLTRKVGRRKVSGKGIKMWPFDKFSFVVRNSSGGTLGYYYSKEAAEKAAARFQADYSKDKLNKNLRVFVEKAR